MSALDWVSGGRWPCSSQEFPQAQREDQSRRGRACDGWVSLQTFPDAGGRIAAVAGTLTLVAELESQPCRTQKPRPGGKRGGWQGLSVLGLLPWARVHLLSKSGVGIFKMLFSPSKIIMMVVKLFILSLDGWPSYLGKWVSQKKRES